MISEKGIFPEKPGALDDFTLSDGEEAISLPTESDKTPAASPAPAYFKRVLRFILFIVAFFTS
jgi:hypothetical protein